MINDLVISKKKTLAIIRSLNPDEVHGWDEISIRMIKLSESSLVTPLKIILTNCLRDGVFPKCESVLMLSRFIRKMKKI